MVHDFVVMPEARRDRGVSEEMVNKILEVAGDRAIHATMRRTSLNMVTRMVERGQKWLIRIRDRMPNYWENGEDAWSVEITKKGDFFW